MPQANSPPSTWTLIITRMICVPKLTLLQISIQYSKSLARTRRNLYPFVTIMAVRRAEESEVWCTTRSLLLEQALLKHETKCSCRHLHLSKITAFCLRDVRLMQRKRSLLSSKSNMAPFSASFALGMSTSNLENGRRIWKDSCSMVLSKPLASMKKCWLRRHSELCVEPKGTIRRLRREQTIYLRRSNRTSRLSISAWWWRSTKN